VQCQIHINSRDISPLCMYLYGFDIVYFVGLISEYIDLKCIEWTSLNTSVCFSTSCLSAYNTLKTLERTFHEI
jgi:hypothetical protein